jgi:glycerol-3-phosphate acyltransferase PlsX
VSAVVLDGMGGDQAPAATVEGAALAAADGIEVVLVGDSEALGREFNRRGGVASGVRIVHAPDAIGMGEHSALDARNRRQSSIYVGLDLVKQGEAASFISAGNTGAVLALALVVLGRVKGVERPALGALLPRSPAPTLLLDAGANAESRVSHLVQFAQLGSAYMSHAVGVAEPRVGLLNIGEEATKGSPLTIEAYRALTETPGIRFGGNVEGRDLIEGAFDVVVTDGFTGNVALKLLEGAVSSIVREVATAAQSSLRARLGGLLLRPALFGVRERLDYRRYGGAPLLGIDGVVMVGHGRSDGQAIASAVKTAAAAADSGVLDALRGSVGGD